MRLKQLVSAIIALIALFTVQLASAQYCTYSGNSEHSQRYLSSFALSDGSNSVSVTSVQSGTYKAIYSDKTSSVLETTAGSTISFSSLTWTGEWMHGFVFIDYDLDGVFNTTLNATGTTAGEVVSYCQYDGYNSLGVSVAESTRPSTTTMPAFTIPSTLAAGDYTVRFKVDWDSLDPCGDDEIAKNGGVICDITLRIEGEASTDGTDLLSFSFSTASNSTLQETVVGTIDGNNIVVDFGFYADIRELTPTFRTNGAQVLVGDSVQTSGVTINNYLNSVVYTVVSDEGETQDYTVTVNNLDLGLPIVYITTEGKAEIVSKDDYMDAELTIDGLGLYTSLETTTVEIKGRGNSTWSYPKKPYAIKMYKDTKSEILDMPVHRKWVLLANWMDRTLMRNTVSFYISESLGLPWTSRNRAVDVILNGEHVGNYVLCEKIEVDENRVNIEELESEDISDDLITGGYLLELDTNYDEVNKFKSTTLDLPVMIKTPDEDDLVTEQFDYIQTYFNQVESYICNGDWDTVFENIDMDTFIDCWIAYELTGNAEPQHPKSLYMYKKRDGKLFSGPLWDFDWGTFSGDASYVVRDAVFYKYLFESEEFYARVKERWNMHRPNLLLVDNFIAEESEKIAASEALNTELWPLTGQTTNGDESMSFSAAIENMRTKYLEKLYFMDEEFYDESLSGLDGTDMLTFSFEAKNNSALTKDVEGVIDGTNIVVDFDTYIDIRSLTPTFTTDGSAVLVDETVQTSGLTTNDFFRSVVYTVRNAAGYTKEYTVTVNNLDLGLPIVYITTEGNAEIVSKDDYMDAELTIDGAGFYTDLETTTVEIKGRGNSTWSYPKKPYAIKMYKDTKSEILDMPVHRKWVLLANWMDRTLMRNTVSFYISESMGLPWTSRNRAVDVILNGEHVGNYVLCEKIEVDENRVDIDELDSEDITDDLITGGYLLELDTNYDEVNKFKSSKLSLPVMIKDPDEDALVTEQFTYIQNFFNEVEGYLYNNDFDSAFEQLDMDTFIDCWIAFELTGNAEPLHPKSLYMYKERDGKLFSGPLWDFDWGTFSGEASYVVKEAAFYKYLFQSEEFCTRLKERWNMHRSNLLKVPDFIMEESEKIAASEALNTALWPLTGQTTNGDESMSFSEAVASMSTKYIDKFNLMDNDFYDEELSQAWDANILTFSFEAKNNSALTKTVEGVIDGNNIVVDFDTYVDIRELVATFTTDGTEVLVGETVQTSGVTTNDFFNSVVYTVTNEAGATDEFTVTVNNLDLGIPVVYITTEGNAEIVSKDDYMDAELTIDGAGFYTDLETTTVEIKGRGNSTWSYPKKPYAIKMYKDTKSEILDMPVHRKWVLLANWMDRTLMRNTVAFKIGELTGLEWTSRNRAVDVILNGEHVGNYVLCEKIEVDENRVNIDELDSEDISDELITGGYLLELDTNYDEVNKFKSSMLSLPVMIKDPDEDTLVSDQFSYIQTYFNQVESYIRRGSYESAFEEIDMDSFIDCWFAFELTGNAEPLHPKSLYMYKKRDGKLFSGPLWDFDWGTFPSSIGFIVKDAVFYSYLFQSEDFNTRVKERWNLLRDGFATIGDFIDEESAKIEASEALNSAMWPLTDQTTNGDEQMSFLEAVETMKYNYNAKFEFMDEQFYDATTGIEVVEVEEAKIYSSKGAIHYEVSDLAQMQIFSVGGALITTQYVEGVGSVSIPQGFYIVKIGSTVKSVVVQ